MDGSVLAVSAAYQNNLVTSQVVQCLRTKAAQKYYSRRDRVKLRSLLLSARYRCMLTCCEIGECKLKVGVGEMPPLLLGRFFNFVFRLFHDERPWERGWVFM